VLLGTSVHPYAEDFELRVREAVTHGAVLIKWLPSAQGINLADERVGSAMKFLARAGQGGGALPLLLHCGAEYAIMAADETMQSYDFLSWSWRDKLQNALRRLQGKKAWRRPDLDGVHANIRGALDAGATIIFAHCGLPYFVGGLLGRPFEHSDFGRVRQYLTEYDGDVTGRCYADVSACCTCFRSIYFRDLRDLPPGRLLFGSDYPTPVSELRTDYRRAMRHMKSLFKGRFKDILVPQGNLIDFNRTELGDVAFRDRNHPVFTNFGSL